MDEITFNYQIPTQDWDTYEGVFYKILTKAKEEMSIKHDLSLSVTFIDSVESLRLNEMYRKKNYAGDVLSFPIDDPAGIYQQLDFQEIGDIFITPEIAIKKAQEYNHDIFAEMCWLFTHGLLHILGYDHELSEQDATIMFDLTDKVLKVVNVEYKIV